MYKILFNRGGNTAKPDFIKKSKSKSEKKLLDGESITQKSIGLEEPENVYQPMKTEGNNDFKPVSSNSKSFYLKYSSKE